MVDIEDGAKLNPDVVVVDEDPNVVEFETGALLLAAGCPNVKAGLSLGDADDAPKGTAGLGAVDDDDSEAPKEEAASAFALGGAPNVNPLDGVELVTELDGLASEDVPKVKDMPDGFFSSGLAASTIDVLASEDVPKANETPDGFFSSGLAISTLDVLAPEDTPKVNEVPAGFFSSGFVEAPKLAAGVEADENDPPSVGADDFVAESDPDDPNAKEGAEDCFSADITGAIRFFDGRAESSDDLTVVLVLGATPNENPPDGFSVDDVWLDSSAFRLLDFASPKLTEEAVLALKLNVGGLDTVLSVVEGALKVNEGTGALAESASTVVELVSLAGALNENDSFSTASFFS